MHLTVTTTKKKQEKKSYKTNKVTKAKGIEWIYVTNNIADKILKRLKKNNKPLRKYKWE